MDRGKILLLVLLCVATLSSLADALEVWRDDFNTGDPLNSRWMKDVDPADGDADLYLGAGQVYFANTRSRYCHLQTGIDGNRVESVIGSVYTWVGSATQWNPGIYTYWDDDNWVGVYIDPITSSSTSESGALTVQGKVAGSYFLSSTSSTWIHMNQYYTLKIGFTDDQVTFGYALGHSAPGDPTVVVDELTMARPSGFFGENALLIYGKGTDNGSAGVWADPDNSDLDNSKDPRYSLGDKSSYVKGSHVAYSEVPEPATILLISLGSSLVLLRKKRV